MDTLLASYFACLLRCWQGRPLPSSFSIFNDSIPIFFFFFFFLIIDEMSSPAGGCCHFLMFHVFVVSLH